VDPVLCSDLLQASYPGFGVGCCSAVCGTTGIKNFKVLYTSRHQYFYQIVSLLQKTRQEVFLVSVTVRVGAMASVIAATVSCFSQTVS
jgi:hypothetical protein